MDETNKVDKNIDKNGKNMGIISRPNASPGYWLCCLLPAALLVTYNQQKFCAYEDAHYRVLTIAGIGMLLQSINFFICLALGAGRYAKLFFALSPGVVSYLVFQYFTQHSCGLCLALGFGITLVYQYAYVRVVRGFPKSCTLGEACILVQGIVLFIVNGLFKLPLLYNNPPNDDEFGEISSIMMSALMSLLIISWLIATVKIFRSPVLFYPSMIILVLVVCTIPVTNELPIITVIKFILSDHRRVYIVIFYMAMAVATGCAVRWQLGSSEHASTSARKIFHVLIVLVYIPGLLFQCTFLYLATGVALAVFSVLDIVRTLKIPPIASILDDAFSTLHDEKDAGNIALTPFCLLIGCSLPLWISPCPCSVADSAAGESLIPMLAGILSVGIGDTAASVIGSKFGKHKWRDSNRSIEGSVAFVLFQFAMIVPLYVYNVTPLSGYSVLATVVAVLLTAVVEALTDQIDNLVLPLIFYIIVSIR